MFAALFQKSSVWATLFARFGVGIVFLFHGAGKLLSIGPYAVGIAGTAGFFANLGIPAAGFFAWLVAIVETFGGLFIIVGLLTRYAAAALAIDMIVALALVHWPKGYSLANGGYEFVLVLLLLLISLLFSGAGSKLVLEKALWKKEV